MKNRIRIRGRRLKPGAIALFGAAIFVVIVGCGGWGLYRAGVFERLFQPRPEAVTTTIVWETPIPATADTSAADPITPPEEPAEVVVEEEIAPTEPVVHDLCEGLPKWNVVIANYPAYYVNNAMQEMEIDKEHGFCLNLVAIESGPEGTDFQLTEDEQAAWLREGRAHVLFTTADTFRQGEYGEVRFATDMSLGADFGASWIPNLQINDLAEKGLKIAATLESVSEYLTIALYDVVGIDAANPDNRRMVPGIETAEEARDAYMRGEADVFVGWIPTMWYDGKDVYTEMVVKDEDGKTVLDEEENPITEVVWAGYKFVDSSLFPAILDVGIFSHQADPQLAQWYTDAYFFTLDRMLRDPEGVAEAIMAWDRKNHGWTGIEEYAAAMEYTPGEALADYMFGIAQAKLAQNEILMRDHQKQAANGEMGILAKHIEHALDIWKLGGVEVAEVNPLNVINPDFVLSTYQRHPEYTAGLDVLFPDHAFTLTGEDPLILTPELAEELDIIATLPPFYYGGDKPYLEGEELELFYDFMENTVKPALAKVSPDQVAVVCHIGVNWPPGHTEYSHESLKAWLEGGRIPWTEQQMANYIDMRQVQIIPDVPTQAVTAEQEQHDWRHLICEFGVTPGGR